MKITESLYESKSAQIDNALLGSGKALIIVGRDDLIEFAKTWATVLQTDHSKPIEKPEIEKPISQPEAILFLGKSRQTLIKWRKMGIIKAHSLGGRIYYLPSELLAALNKLG